MNIIPRVPSVTLQGDKGASVLVKTDVDKHSGKIPIRGGTYLFLKPLFQR